MSMGINIGMPGVLGAGDAAIQASLVSEEPAGPVDITVILDAADAINRQSDDGNYYTITIPDDFLSKFAPARDGAGKIGTAVDATSNLNVILNIASGVQIGANTANALTESQASHFWDGASGHYYEAESWSFSTSPYPWSHFITDPCIHFKFNTDEWDDDILDRLNVTVNNYGVVIGGGGAGGYAGMDYDETTGKNPVTTWTAGDGGGGGQGLHPDWGTTASDFTYDPDDAEPYKAGQGGRGWIGPDAAGANGAQGTTTGPGGGGLSANPNAGGSETDDVRAEDGFVGGSVIYITSNTFTTTSSFNLEIFNKGWMSAGAGGGGGGWGGAGDGGDGGTWGTAGSLYLDVAGNDTGLGSGDGGGGTKGGYPGWMGSLMWNAGDGSESAARPGRTKNLNFTSTVTNQSSNTIYGWDGAWAPE